MRKIVLTALMVLVLGCWNMATAGIINIGNGATGSNPSGTLGAGDPNLIGTGSDISVAIQGSAAITNEVLLSLLVPNDTTDLFGSTNPLATVSIYSSFPGSSTGTGSSAFVGDNSTFMTGTATASYKGNGFWGNLAVPSSGTTTLADFLGAGFNPSNQTSNWTAFDSSLGVTASGYGVYTFLITTNGALSGHNNALIDISIPGGAPLGSIFTAVDDNGNSVVWTNAGGVDASSPPPPSTVPEPASLALLGTGLLGLALLVRRRASEHTN